jgi:hypothetical protein
MTLSSSVNPSTRGQSVTFTVHIASQDGQTPTGNVWLSDDYIPNLNGRQWVNVYGHQGNPCPIPFDSMLYGPIPLSGGQATFEIDSLLPNTSVPTWAQLEGGLMWECPQYTYQTQALTPSGRRYTLTQNLVTFAIVLGSALGVTMETQETQLFDKVTGNLESITLNYTVVYTITESNTLGDLLSLSLPTFDVSSITASLMPGSSSSNPAVTNQVFGPWQTGIQHQIFAYYSGDANFCGPSSGTPPAVVNQVVTA